MSGHPDRFAFEAGSMTITAAYAESRTDRDRLPDNGTHVGPLSTDLVPYSPDSDLIRFVWPQARIAYGWRLSRS